MTTTNVPAGIDYEGVSRFFAEFVEGGDTELDIALIAGGRSNLTYLVQGGGHEWVMRRPPLGHVAATAHDMAREYRVITALGGTDVAVPKTFALCEDDAYNGAPFYVMEYKKGVIVAAEIPEGYAGSADDKRRMSVAMIDMLARLHAVDYEAVGLGDFGRPQGYLERQVRRWNEQWERSKTREIAEIDEVIRRLKNSIPESPPPTIVHGDYRLGNMILNGRDPGMVEAVLDWEMCTLGDPLSDVGWTLVYWGEVGETPEELRLRNVGSVTAQPGFLTRDELVAEYSERSGRDVRDIDFYTTLAQYKLAVIGEGIYARFLQGKTVGEGFEGQGESTVRMVHAALQTSDRSSNPRLRGA